MDGEKENRCETCAFWRVDEDETDRGDCQNDKFKHHQPNDMYDAPIEGVGLLGTMRQGKNFGCIHHKRRA